MTRLLAIPLVDRIFCYLPGLNVFHYQRTLHKVSPYYLTIHHSVSCQYLGDLHGTKNYYVTIPALAWGRDPGLGHSDAFGARLGYI